MESADHRQTAHLDRTRPLSARLASHWIRLPLATQLALAAAILLVPLWTVLLLEMRRHEADSREAAVHEVSAMATLGAEVLRAQAHAADQLLIHLREEWSRDRAAFDAHVRRRQAESGVTVRLEVTVVDASGRVAYASAMPAAVGADFSKRTVFSAHRDGDIRGLRIGEPTWGPLAQRVVVPFSRSMEDAAGRFAGVIVLPMQVAYLAESFETMRLRPGWQIVAVHDSGAIMFQAIAAPAPNAARSTLQVDRPATSAGDPAPRPGSPTQRGLPAEGASVETSRIDGTRRLYAWRRVGSFPLTLAVGQPEAAIAQEVAANRRPTIIMGLAASALLLLALYWLLRLLRARRAQVEQLRRGQAELQASQRELKALTARLQDIREEEDTRIAREIHDELGQRLTVLRMDVSMLPRLVQADPAALLPAQVQALKADIDEVIGIVRDISSRLRPAALEAGLAEAVAELVENMRSTFGIACGMDSCLPAMPLADAVVTAAYRIVQESLTNAVRHASARSVDIALAVVADELHVEVRDDGRGFDPQSHDARAGTGLASMRERAASLGGVLQIDSRPGAGTTIRARLPLDGKAARRDDAAQPGRAPTPAQAAG